MGVKVEAFVSKLLKVSYVDYSGHNASTQELEEFSVKYQLVFGQKVDPGLLDLLASVNGFDENGLCFYGTHASNKKYVLDFFERNEFWRSEVVGLIRYVVVADGDMDFFVRDLSTRDYLVLSKIGLSVAYSFASLEELLAEMSKLYF